jgi:O-antigen/teichoic acid export membrane protein
LTNLASLKARAVSGIKWNSIGEAGRLLISFAVSVVLARLLTPKDFGLIAMLLIFQEIANAFINSGLNAPLIQNRDISQVDCSTIFYFNLGVGSLSYLLLVVCAPQIASFYGEPQLKDLIKYFGLAFLIHSAGNVQAGLLLRDLNYRSVNIVLLIGVSLSGFVAVSMAIHGWGVYSLLGQQISYALISTTLYWANSRWRPSLAVSATSFVNLFGFGSKVLLSSLLDKTVSTVDNVIIGKVQGSGLLGLYGRGKNTRDLPITSITNVITSLVFPVFSRIDSPGELRAAHSRFIGLVSYLAAPLMVGMAILAEPLVVVLYSEKWLPSVFFLRMFCVFGITVPLNSILVQTILSRGSSSTFLKLELGKRSVLLASMTVGAFLSAGGFVLALCIGNYVTLFMSVCVVAKLLEVSPRNIVSGMLPGVLLSLAMGIPIYLMGRISWHGNVERLLASSLVGICMYIGLSALFGSKDYFYICRLISDRLQKRRPAEGGSSKRY